MSRPVVAIVGRPNVGKSTLFNRLAGMRKAIVEDIAGITRDRIYEKSEWSGREFTVIDTGGLRMDEGEIFAQEVKRQAEIAIEEADVIIFVVDTRAGLTHEDEMVANMLRKSDKAVVLAANKVENFHNQLDYHEFYGLGLGEPIPLSAIHGMNVNDLLDAVVQHFPSGTEEEEAGMATRIAVVGRPNVGKSSLVNAILGEERVIVSDIPGTTRDAIDTYFDLDEKQYVLIDTAGIRRKSKITESIERYSVIRAYKAIERAEAVLMVIDATEGVTDQDKRIAGFIHEEGRASIIVVNKWDLVQKDGKTMKAFDEDIREELKFLAYTPILYVSALTGKRVPKILELVDFIVDQYHRRIATADLNKMLNEAQLLNPPPGAGKKRLRIYYGTQIKTGPPAFVLFVNDSELMHFSYTRYIDNTLRQTFGFEGTPIRIYTRNKEGRE